MNIETGAHGYTVAIDEGQTHDAGTDEELRVPPAARVKYEEGDGAFAVMVGRSPVDGEMVIHADTSPAIPLARLYINDTLAYGTEDGAAPKAGYTVIGYWNDADEAVAVGVIAGQHGVLGGAGATEGGDWATWVEAENADDAEAQAVEEMEATLSPDTDDDDDDDAKEDDR